MTRISYELWFLWRDRAAKVWLVIACLAASIAVVFGLNEINSQRDTIARLQEADQIERTVATQEHRDWGSAAYYTFHLTYDAPEDFAFAALGQRDASPWKHRVRMLALEGQIYETDAANPEFALIGRFDFAFVAAMIAPLILIMVLHDLRASERTHGRYNLLSATSADANRLWFSRAAWRVGALALALLLPLWVGGLVSGASMASLAWASLAVLAHLIFWWGVIAFINTRLWSSTTNLTALIGLWLALAVVTPAVIKWGVDASIPVPEGGDIILTQREAVNDAWDLPKEATMTPFLARYPELAPHADLNAAFEWKWYYAFQQVGDQTAEPLSTAYRSGRERRDDLAGVLTWLSPPAKLERTLQGLAGTDTAAALEYEDRVRAFHAELRAFYYPPLFEDQPFTDAALSERPNFREFIQVKASRG
jgi:ABC-2 type transport system permease protein